MSAIREIVLVRKFISACLILYVCVNYAYASPLCSKILQIREKNIFAENVDYARSSIADLTVRAQEILNYLNYNRKLKKMPLYTKVSDFRPHGLNKNILLVDFIAEDSSELTLASIDQSLIYLGWGHSEEQKWAFNFDNGIMTKQNFDEFVISKIPDGYSVPVVRNMGENEFQLWIKRDPQLFRKGNNWGYAERVMHFELGQRSWIGSHRRRAATFIIPRDALVRWVNQNEATFGVTLVSSTIPSGLNMELVLKDSAWIEMQSYFTDESLAEVSIFKRILSGISFGVLRVLGKHRKVAEP